MGWLTGWQYRRAITIDRTKVDSDLYNFPVLVALTSSNFNFSKARTDGYDIRFTSSDGTTLLDYERERHNASSQVAEYWVRVPLVSSTSDTVIYMYYGKSDASDGQNKTGVWDSNFKAVWHLHETAGTHYDSTSNNNHGTPYGGVIQGTTAKIDGGDQFDGYNDYVEIPHSSSLLPNDGSGPGNGSWTISVWMKPPNSEQASGLVAKRQNDWFPQYSLCIGNMLMYPAKTILFIYMEASPNPRRATATTINIVDGNWHHVVGVADKSLGKALIYVDGVLAPADYNNAGSWPIINNTQPAWLGRWTSTSYYYSGLLDEVRLTNGVRSAAWIKAEYHAGNGTLLSVGSEEQQTAAAKIPWHLFSMSM